LVTISAKRCVIIATKSGQHSGVISETTHVKKNARRQPGVRGEIQMQETMENSNTTANRECQRPSITDVIGNYIDLRQRGRELWGLCPFHAEKTPSFAVNPEKQVFYCHGCHAGGGVITFIETIEGVDFKTATRRLGLESYRPSPDHLRVKAEAKRIAEWASTTSTALSDALREIGDEIYVCKLLRRSGKAHAETIQHEICLVREWAILCDLQDDLNDPKLALELWTQREDIDRLVESVS
jgi:hypothetical protein